jgi:predicted AAA+ superfamily ATPase
MINRPYDSQKIKQLIALFPVTAIFGARQCGKTTLARQLGADSYFDFENPRDLKLLDNPQTMLETLTGLVVIDEVQRKPELFALLRYLVDTRPQTRYVILGSASRELIRQSSESLAGRIGHHWLGGLRLTDVGPENLIRMWVQGSLPRTYTLDGAESCLWTANYVTALLERDFPELGIRIPADTLRRFWMMLSHYHGQVINYSELARSFGVSVHTVNRYIELLAGTFMVRILKPWYVNIGKRLVKSPKIYIRDSGVLHHLLSIQSFTDILSHHRLGALWEGFALETVARSIDKRDDEIYFWRTHAGSEADLFWQADGKNWAAEFKYADAPSITKAMTIAIDDLQLAHLWVIYPGDKRYSLHPKITVLPLAQVGNEWNYV